MSSFDNRPRSGDDQSERWNLPRTQPRLRKPDAAPGSPNPDARPGLSPRPGNGRGPVDPRGQSDGRPSGRQKTARPARRPVDPRSWDLMDEAADQWDTALLPAMQLDQFATDAVPVYRTTGRFRKPPVERDASAPAPSKPPATTDEEDEGLPTWILPVVKADVQAQTTMRLPVVAPAAKSYVELVRNLATSSGIYMIASLSAPFVSLVLAPFLTHRLTPADYGTLAICNTLISLVAGISQLGLGSAFFRAFGYDYTTLSGRRSVITSVTILLLAASLLVVGATSLWSREIAAALFNDPSRANLVAIVGVVILIQNLSVPGLAWMRAINKPSVYSALAIGNLLIALGANIYLVGVAHQGIRGALIATGCGYAFIALIMTPVGVVYSRLQFRLDVAWSVVSFGVPLVLGTVSSWILGLSDRYLLTIFGSLDQVAHYSVAYSLGTVVSTLVIAPFQTAWPTAMYAIAKRPDAQQVYKIVFRWFGMLVLLAAFGLAVCCTAVLSWLFPPSYKAAAPVIPVVGLSLAIYGVYVVFMIGANLRRKTWMGGVFTMLAALINVGLNLILIPRYGAFGAAAATLFAYIALAIITYIGTRIIYPVPYEIGRFTIAMLSGIALYVGVGELTKHTGIAASVAIGAVGFLVYAAWLVFLAGGVTRLRRPASRPAPSSAGSARAGSRV